jgi:hypothetical protein
VIKADGPYMTKGGVKIMCSAWPYTYYVRDNKSIYEFTSLVEAWVGNRVLGLSELSGLLVL